MKRTLLLLFALLSLAFNQLSAQSYETALDYYNMQEYQKAAQMLRPLADGGDARAQALAAEMFFEGKGVPKNDQQGIKYATLSANQGNEEGINCLASYYFDKRDFKKFYAILHEYVEVKHPYLLRENIGARVALCYITGTGVEKNEDWGWNIMRQNPMLDSYTPGLADSWKAYQERHPEYFRVYDVVAQMPSFPGGQQGLSSWLSENIDNFFNQDGRVVYSFIVERDGTLSNVRATYNKGNIGQVTIDLAIKALNNMPKWIPGIQNGKNVRVNYSLPITYTKGK